MVHAGQKFPEQRGHLHARKVLAQTDVGAETEGQIAAGRTIDLEFEGRLEDVLVPVRRRVPEHDGFARRDLPIPQHVVRRGRAHELTDRGHPADHLVDRAFQVSVGIVTQPGELCRVVADPGQRPAIVFPLLLRL